MRIILLFLLLCFSLSIEVRNNISIPIEVRFLDKIGVFAYLVTQDITHIVTTNEYVPVSGNFYNDPVDKFILVSDPAIEYVNGSGYNFVIDYYACLSAPANNTTVKCAIKKNGSIVNSSIMTQLCKVGGDRYTISGECVVGLEYGDKIQLVITSDNDNSNITVVNFTTSIRRFF